MKSPPLSWQSGNYLEESSSGAVVDGKEAASDENVNSNRLMLKMLKDCSNILRIKIISQKKIVVTCCVHLLRRKT